MRIATLGAALPLLALSLASCATTTSERLKLPPVETVDLVELPKYLGTWYELASYPKSGGLRRHHRHLLAARGRRPRCR